MSFRPLKVLLTVNPRWSNSYVRDQISELDKLTELTVGRDLFWKDYFEYDILHLQWPAYMLPQESHSENDLMRFEQQLQKWGRHCKVIFTYHDFHPPWSNSTFYKELFRICFQYADAVIHLGEFSKKHLQQVYPKLYTLAKQVLIPHPDYSSLGQLPSKQAARKQLKISSQAKVMLVLGDLRHPEERSRMINAFKYWRHSNKLLLCPRSEVSYCGLRQKSLVRRAFNKVRRMAYNFSGSYALGNKIPDEQELLLLLAASDFLFIPRQHVLNSGLLFLALTYGIPVVGPKSGNLTEVLEAHESVGFEDDELSLERAVNIVLRENSRVTKYHCLPAEVYQRQYELMCGLSNRNSNY